MNMPGDCLSNPQQLNIYAYTLNNPIMYVDPSGQSALAATLTAFSADVSIPEFTDLLLWKFVGWGVAIGGAAILDAALLSKAVENSETQTKTIADAKTKTQERRTQRFRHYSRAEYSEKHSSRFETWIIRNYWGGPLR